MGRLRCLPQEALKLIACVTMLIDHVGAVFFPDTLWLRMIGRLAFPIYCFLLAEGMRKTRSPEKYLLRLFVGIFLAELPFDHLFFGGFTWEHQSVMVTLFLGGMMLLVQMRCQEGWLRYLLVVPFALIAEACGCDYGGYGIVLIAVFALTDQWYWQLPLFLVLNLGMDGEYMVNSLTSFHEHGWATDAAVRYILKEGPPIQSLSLAAMMPICLYSGKKLTRSRLVQIGFYLFYPVHLVFLLIFANYLL